MDLKRIDLTNFGAFGHETLHLAGIHLACVSGPNGAGKSTLFTDSLRYALFGTSRTGSADDLVRKGQQDMAVQIEFALGGQEYRILRSRSAKGKGKSGLEFQAKNGDGGWHSLTGASIRETEQRIVEILKVTEDTFISSCLILQGRSNEFTTKGPADRKRVLSQILGLDVYDRLQARAREKGRAIEAEIKAQKDRLTAIEADVAGEAGIILLRDQAAENVARAEEKLKATRARLEEVQRSMAEIIAKRERGADLASESKRLEAEVADLQLELGTLLTSLERAKKIIENEVQIRAKDQEAKDLRARIAAIESGQPRRISISQEIGRLQRQTKELTDQVNRTAARATELRRALADKDRIEKAAARYREVEAELQRVTHLQNRATVLDGTITAAKARIELAKVHHRAAVCELDKRLEDLRKRAAMLQDSGCIDPDRAGCKFLVDAKTAREQIAIVEREREALTDSDSKAAEAELARLQEERAALGYDPAAHDSLQEETRELKPLADQAAQLEGKAQLLETLDSQVQSGLKALDEAHEPLDRLIAEMNEFERQEAEFPTLKSRLAAAEQWARGLEELPAAKETIETADSKKAAITAKIDSRRARLTEIQDELQRIALLDQALNSAVAERRALESEIGIQEASHREAVRSLAQYDQQLATIAKLKSEREAVQAAVGEKARAASCYDILAKAFSRDGIPALIIENAIPELQAIANEILGRMTNGGMNVQFQTQREMKTVKDRLEETLEIIVADWQGPRPYETFSGGEKFRIDFAIRVGLAMLLARRAGTSLRLLIVDEGLGSLDADGRDQLLEAINAIERDFAQVIVISHIEAIKDAFPTRLEVEPGPDGSKVRVA